jgi:hypothetical protein
MENRVTYRNIVSYVIYHVCYLKRSQYNLVGIATRLRAGRPGFDSRQKLRISLAIASRPAPGPTQLPVQEVSWVKRPGHEADQVNTWIYTSTPTVSSHGVVIN